MERRKFPPPGNRNGGAGVRNIMKCQTGLFPLLLAAVIGFPSLRAADEETDRRLGDDAFNAGDYANAVKFFGSAMNRAGEDDEAWAADALKLAASHLRNRDVAGAKAVLAEFRNRFPARSAGLLPGEIMTAERRYADAEKFFSALVASAADPEQSCIARFNLALTRLSQQKFDAALSDLEQLETENADLPGWAEKSHLARIYALILAGRCDEADVLLVEGKYHSIASKEYSRLMLLNALRKGDYDTFKAKWPEVLAAAEGHGDRTMRQLAADGVAEAEKRGDHETAEQLYLALFELAATDLEQRDAMRSLINLYAEHNPEQAAATIRRYLELFPTASDRAELLMRGGRLLVKLGKPGGALEFFRRVAGDGELPLEPRLAASREAASTAEAAGDLKSADEMLQNLVKMSETVPQKQEANYLYGEYLYRRREFARAADHLKVAVDLGGTRADEARYRLLLTLVELGKFEAAMPVAEQLRHSGNGEFAMTAEYFRALLLEEAGRSTEARSAYLKFLLAYPKSTYTPSARFNAAGLAMELKEYPAATTEFFAFATDYPDSPNTPAALYLAMQSACFAGDTAAADRAIKQLDQNYPADVCALEARLQLADFLRSSGDSAGALARLAEAEQKLPENATEAIAEIGFQRARIQAAGKEPEKALGQLAELLDRYAASSIGADAAMLAGNLNSDLGNYREALKNYSRALELRPTGLFAELCRGRIADCRYSLYATTLDKADLDVAATTYAALAETSEDPRIVLQSLYKLGKCRELEERHDAALEAYDRLLYLAGDLKKRGIAPDPVWTGKAAYAAVLANLRTGTPSGARTALRVISQYEALNLPPTGEEFDRIRQEIRRKFNLQEKF